MTKELEIFLECAEHAGPERRKRLLSQIDPKIKTVVDGKTVNVRELLMTEKSHIGLIQAEVMKTLVAGAQIVRGVREVVPIVPMKAATMTIDVSSTAGYSTAVGEGASPMEDNEDPTANTLTAKTYRELAYISNDLIDDGLFAIINMNLEYCGAKLENQLNYAVLDAILEGSGNETDATGSNLGIKAVAKAIGVNKTAGYIPYSLLMHPEAEALIMQDYIPTGAYYQVGNTATTGRIPPVLGLKTAACSSGSSGSTYTWGYAADGEIGMLIIAKNAAVIGMRQDISFKKFEENIRDLVGLTAKMRAGAKVLNSTGITRCEY